MQVVQQITFSADSAAGFGVNALVLQHAASLRTGHSGAIDRFRLFPPVAATFSASVGAVTVDPQEGAEPVVELVQFSGTRRAGLRYPRGWNVRSAWLPVSPSQPGFSGGANVSIEVVSGFDENGRPIVPGVAYDGETNELVADVAFRGMVRATYSAPFRPISLYRGADNAIRSGNLTAMYQGAIAEASFGAISLPQPIPVYSVVSEYVADENGAWEVPPGWPDDATYPDTAPEPLPNKDSYQQLERVHESAYLDYDGTLRIEQYIVHHEQPYEDSGATYAPQYRLDEAAAPDEGSLWEDAWAELDLDDLRAEVSARYPGIEVPA